MNIAQALDVALPELPAKLMSQRYPRIDPGVVAQEHIEEGERMVWAVVPGLDAMFMFPPLNWKLIQLFDGVRSYEEIADLYSQETGQLFSAEAVRDFAAEVDAMNFWYKTPQEKNVRLMQKSAEERRKILKGKSRWGDLAEVKFPAVNPDPLLTWLYRRLSFVFTWSFTLLTLLAFAFTTWIFVTHWSEIGRDTYKFYNFTNKSLLDLVFFWAVGASVIALHELAHGFACKSLGARVPAIGLVLMYLLPCFYTDVTEGMVLANKLQRLMISISGVWAELILCAIATPIWWNTAPGTALHDFCYLVILFTGVAVIFMNWNPLMKLDGYYIMIEILDIPDLKETSTLYLSGWVKKNIWRLPVEVPYVPRRRRVGYAIYAVLSGLYSYSLLYLIAGLVGNIFKNFTHDWAFVFEYGTAYVIFQGRIRTLVNFMKFVYLDKKDRVAGWFTGQRRLAVAVGAAILVLVPIWHESAEGRFLLEPDNRAVIRAMVPGFVSQVNADEGQQVAAGAPLFRLRNLPLESKLAGSVAAYDQAAARKTSALLHYADFGAAEQERAGLAIQTLGFRAEASELEVNSPIAGTVLSARLKDLVGSYVPAGTQLAEVADLRRLRARIYISEYDMNKFKTGASAGLHVDGMFGKRDVQSVTIAPVSSEIAPSLMDLSKFAGMSPPNFYVVDMVVANPDGRLAPGMIGTARVYGRRRSLAAFALQAAADFAGRKLW